MKNTFPEAALLTSHEKGQLAQLYLRFKQAWVKDAGSDENCQAFCAALVWVVQNWDLCRKTLGGSDVPNVANVSSGMGSLIGLWIEAGKPNPKL